MWCSDRATAYDRYGHINDWEVSKVNDMGSLFNNTTFNDRIDRWDVRNVTSMGDEINEEVAHRYTARTIYQRVPTSQTLCASVLYRREADRTSVSRCTLQPATLPGSPADGDGRRQRRQTPAAG